jgi:hypothetical protein
LGAGGLGPKPLTRPRSSPGRKQISEALAVGTGHLSILLALDVAPFLWDAYPRDMADSTLLVVALTLVTAAGMLTWFTMRSLARSRYRFRLHTFAGLVILCLVLAVVSNRLHFKFRCWNAQRHLARAGGYSVVFDFVVPFQQ